MKRYIGLAVLLQSIINVYAIQISEIMYDPAGSDTGHEWIEIYNDTNTAIDVKSLKFFESSANHGISIVSGNDFLNAGEYAVIADNAGFFSVDNPGFTAALFDSAFSLSNSGEALEMKSSSGESLHKVTYIPVPESSGTGNTLSLINGQYVKSQSTPGLANIEFTGTVSTSTGNTSTTTTNTTSNNTANSGGYYIPTSKRTYMLGDINMLTNKDMYSTVGAETYFELRNADSKNQNINGNVYWSYGDGIGGVGATTTHVYQSSGVFSAFVEVENSSVYGIDRISVHVRDPKLEVFATSGGVVIYNHDDEDIDIGGFNIFCENGIFKVARHLLITKQTSVMVHNKNIGFDCRSPKLRFANNSLVPMYTPPYKYENKNQSVMFNFATTTNVVVAKKPIYKKPKTKISTGIVLGTSSAAIKMETKPVAINVEKGVVTGVKKWLYWLYE